VGVLTTWALKVRGLCPSPCCLKGALSIRSLAGASYQCSSGSAPAPFCGELPGGWLLTWHGSASWVRTTSLAPLPARLRPPRAHRAPRQRLAVTGGRCGGVGGGGAHRVRPFLAGDGAGNVFPRTQVSDHHRHHPTTPPPHHAPTPPRHHATTHHAPTPPRPHAPTPPRHHATTRTTPPRHHATTPPSHHPRLPAQSASSLGS